MELAVPADERDVVLGVVVAEEPREGPFHAPRLLLLLLLPIFTIVVVIVIADALEHLESLHEALLLLRGDDLPVRYEYPVAPLDFGVVEKLLHKIVDGPLQVLLPLAVVDLLVRVRPPLYEREQKESTGGKKKGK